MTSSISLNYLKSLLGDSFTQDVTLEHISQDLELLKTIVSIIREKPFVEPFISIYQWCLQQAKHIVKQKMKIKEQELSVIITNHTLELEGINKKINNQSSLNQRRELNNQDLSRVIFLERKLASLIEKKTFIQQIDLVTNFDDVVSICN